MPSLRTLNDNGLNFYLFCWNKVEDQFMAKNEEKGKLTNNCSHILSLALLLIGYSP